MTDRSALEQKLRDEAAATRRCVTALDKVDTAAQRRIVVWLAENYLPAEPAEQSGDHR